LTAEPVWGFTLGFTAPEKLLESQSVLAVRSGGVKASVAFRYAGTTNKQQKRFMCSMELNFN
jgi:hypothetical protein